MVKRSKISGTSPNIGENFMGPPLLLIILKEIINGSRGQQYLQMLMSAELMLPEYANHIDK